MKLTWLLKTILKLLLEKIIKSQQKILKALEMICNCNFEISPKIIKGINQSCRFCEFKECCFVNFNNYKYLDNQEISEENFEMAGDSNGN